MDNEVKLAAGAMVALSVATAALVMVMGHWWPASIWIAMKQPAERVTLAPAIGFAPGFTT